MGNKAKLKSVSISIPHTHPGRVWGGILHVLNSQHWHWRSIKKRLPHKKHDGAKSDADAENPAESVRAPSNSDSSSKYTEVEVANSSKVEGKKKRPSGSVKSRLKALITEEMSRRKGRGRHRRSSTYPTRGAEDGSNHDAEAPIDDDPLPEILALGAELVAQNRKNNTFDSSSEDQVLEKSMEEPMITTDEDQVLTKSLEASDENSEESSLEHVDESEKQFIENAIFSQEGQNDRKQAFLRQKSKDGSPTHHSNCLLDALDLITMNKEFLEKILQDPGSPLAHHFHRKKASFKKRIAKSGTFPSPGSSSRRGSSSVSNKQKQKQDEAKENESEVSCHGKVLLDQESTEEICRKSMPMIAADHRADGIHQLNQANAEIPDISCSSSSAHHLDQTSGNQTAKRRFKHLKQKIKHAIKESKKERYRIAMDAVLHKIPHRKGFSKDLTKDIVDYFKDPSKIKDVFSESSSSSKRLKKHERRSTSFNDSIERYMQLYESNFNREAKEHISKGIQVTREVEDINLPHRVAPKSLERIFSSPELHSYHFNHGEDYSSDAFSLDMPTIAAYGTLSTSSFNEQGNHLDVSAALDCHSHLDTLGESDLEDNLTDSSALYQLARTSSAKSETVVHEDNDSQTDQQDSKPGTSTIVNVEELSPIPLLSFNFEEKIGTSAEIIISQDLEPNHSDGFPDKLELLDDEEHEFRDTTMVTKDRVEFEIGKDLKKDLDTDDEDKFNYVREVLELSGFSGNEALGRWYANDQPLNPLVFEKVKGCNFYNPHCSKIEEGDYCNYHQLLFDLINEVLLELYEKSYSYYPRQLSSLCHIRTMPVGHYVLNEVWANISWYLSFETGYHKPLDYVASKDLTRSDGWMNLQFEIECIGLEIEELIFNDLLEELV
ncbi:hypothetical protein COLO4_14800 [Corchorus olitorius]|uniref:DUF4378 domain-containing protein n=1 Tax=Corchorus olitorius TaxID=93759 RepID=A0A1R3JQT8_9ROSI|nr:hypothetical protein COLO4_14800 [Corchorus olitorius]